MPTVFTIVLTPPLTPWPCGLQVFGHRPDRRLVQVRKAPRSWANFSPLLAVFPHRDARANSRPSGQPDAFLAAGERQIDILNLVVYL